MGIRSFIRRLLYPYRMWRANAIRPRMVSGFVRGDGVFLSKTRMSSSTFLDAPHNLDIADDVFIGHFNFLEASNGIKIGTGCQVTNYVSMISHSSHMAIRLYGAEYSTSKDHISYVKGSIEIGEYTFVGPNSVIMAGTKIGKGSLISAYSYVKGEFPDFAIIGGNPGRVIGDTRKLDKRYIDRNPELKPLYEAWAGTIE
jgi:acetyltransferase-like isoleucine patch superfamily enzyme